MDGTSDGNVLAFCSFLKDGISLTTLSHIRKFLHHLRDGKFIVMIDFKTIVWFQLPEENRIPVHVFRDKLNDLDDHVLFECYRKRRLLMIGNLEGTPALASDESLDLIKRTLHRQTTYVRELVIPAKTVYSPRNCTEDTKNTGGAESTRHIGRSKTGSKCVQPRPEHSPEIVPFEPSVTAIKGLEPIEVVVCPAGTQYSIQATETDGAPSFAPNGQPHRLNHSITYGFEYRRPTLDAPHFLLSITEGRTPEAARGTGTPRATRDVPYPQANIELPPPRSPAYANIDKRIDSYYGVWDPVGKPPVDELAKWGFFCAGRFDLVRCYQCGSGLKDWVEYDDVMIEHIKASPDCPFLIAKLGQDKVNRLKLAAIYPDVDFSENDTTREADHQRLSNVSTSASALPTQTSTVSDTALVKPMPFQVRHPRYQTMEARLGSLSNLPQRVLQSHQDLAIAGFFYTGTEDIIRCFTCDGGLRNLDPEDRPIEEHAKHFPTCQYILSLKGREWVNKIKLEAQGATGGTGNAYLKPPAELWNGTPHDVLQTTIGENPKTRRKQDCAEYLRSSSARTVLEMGFSKNAVKVAIEQLLDRGVEDISSEVLANHLIIEGQIPATEDTPKDAHSSTNVVEADDVFTENARLKSLFYCMLCVNAPADILCLPCTHHRICHECAKVTTQCPDCGRRIQEKIRTYLG